MNNDVPRFGADFLDAVERPVFASRGPIVSAGDPTADDGPRNLSH